MYHQFLSNLRKNFNMTQEQFAQAVNGMHGFPQPVTAEMIADLEDVYSKNKYPRPILEEIALLCTRKSSVGHSRLIELEDIQSFAARALSADEAIGWQWHAPVEAVPEATEEPIEDTSPALPIAG